MLEGYPEAARTLRDAMASRLSQSIEDLSGVKGKLQSNFDER
jgi:hypothetical protein